MDIDFEADETLKNSHLFTGTKSITVNKQDIFNYGVFNYPIPPEKIGDNDFEYLQNKIPAYRSFHDEQIDFQENKKRIVTNVTGEDAKVISEFVGIALVLKSAETILNLAKRIFKKIPVSESQGKNKRLDFASIFDGRKIEIETKGTMYKGNIKGMIKDIHDKKKDQEKLHSEKIDRYGFITLLQNTKDKNTTKIFATDPDDYSNYQPYEGIYSFIRLVL